MVEEFNGCRERGDLLSDRVAEASDLLVEEIDVREDRSDPQGVHAIKAALQRFAQRGDLLAQPALGQVGEDLGSVVPLISASSIAHPETPRMSEATQSSLMPVSSRALCNRLAAFRARSWICVLR